MSRQEGRAEALLGQAAGLGHPLTLSRTLSAQVGRLACKVVSPAGTDCAGRRAERLDPAQVTRRCCGLPHLLIVERPCLTFLASSSERPPSVSSRVAIIWATPTAELPAP